MRFFGIIISIFLSFWSGHALAASASAHKITPAETRICQSVRHCVDIVRRHGPDAFDYELLHSSFFKFGHKGQSALLKMMVDKDETTLRRAQNILARGGGNFSSAQQSQIAKIWPRGDVKAHAKIMAANLSPIIQSRAITTLSHENKKIRELSRDILIQADNPLSKTDFLKLSKATINEPTPALIRLLSKVSPEINAPILTRTLRSGENLSVIAAYEALFTQNPKTAFQAMVGTLYDLKPEEYQAAFGLGALLRHRHKNRSDGFYLSFAKDIAEDPKMSVMGRLAGFDAVMRNTHKTDAILTNSPVMQANLQLALDNMKTLPLAYIRNYPLHAKDNRSDWAKLIWAKLKSDPYQNPLIAEAFFSSLGAKATPDIQDIISDALADQRDFGMIILGIAAATAQKDKSRMEQFKSLKLHPITDVRAYADLAIMALKNEAAKITNITAKKKIQTLNQASNLCHLAPKNFRADVKQLPFFDLDVSVQNGWLRRKDVSTAAPTRQGWLVGYAAGKRGGDLQYYDNKTGSALPIMYPQGWNDKSHRIHQNVQAIIAVTPQIPGQYSSDFWVFINDGGSSNHVAVYRLSQRGQGFKLTRHAQLPSPRLNLSQESNGDIFIGFGESGDKNNTAHPPLLLSKSGSLHRACDGTIADPLKALP